MIAFITICYSLLYILLFNKLKLIPKNAGVADFAQVLHITFAFVIVGAVALHVALALKRHLVDRDRFLKRMVP